MSQQIIHKIEEMSRLEEAVREYIQTAPFQKELMSKSNNWHQVCCSLDAIGDTLIAINDYIESDYTEDIGLKYILAYGLLQALIVQQDAISHLSEAFSIEYSHGDELEKVRRIRNAAIGHPTKQDRGKPKGHVFYNYISRPTLSQRGFTLLRSGDKVEFYDIDLYEIIHCQLDEVKKKCEIIVGKLKEVYKSYKDKYETDLLVDIFDRNMADQFKKIGLGIHSPDPSNIPLAHGVLKGVQEAYSKFEKAFKERAYMEPEDQVKLDEYKYALAKLETYLGGEQENITKDDAMKHWFYIREKHKEFEQEASNIDEHYATE